jgi:Ca2+-transporting ATPase
LSAKITVSSIQVPADGIMVEGHSLSIDESAMTGESDPVRTVQSLLMFAFPV